MELPINKILNGDCLEHLRKLPDESVDAVITDPPAGISFMGRSWDTFDKSMFGKKGEEGKNDLKIEKNFEILPRYGNSDLQGFQNFICEVFIEVKRVLKPGGHCLVWAIPRTSHHTAMGIERAGFEVRDIVSHIFGCLSEDTEVLTLNGWEHYHKNIYKHPIFIYDIENGIYKWEIPEKWNEYKVDDTCYRIKSDFTDQLVSRNHRVPVEQDGRIIFKFAETLECEENIPFLESVPSLSETISDLHKRTSNKKQKLQGMSESTKRKMEQRKIQNQSSNMQILSKDIQTKMGNNKESNLLFLQLQSKGECKTSPSILQQFNGKEMSKQGFKYGEESCLEGGGNLLQNSWELCGSKICEMSNRIYSYGKEGWLCNGTPIDNGKASWKNVTKNRSCTSQRPQPYKQSDRKFNSVQKQSGTQETRGYRITRAKITKEKYHGLIFCPNVSTRCFVARRNNKIFITGNSGFPKSLNIGKKIDKIQGNEREVIGRDKNLHKGNAYNINKGWNQNNLKSPDEVIVTKGNSEWEGWGTALKPAVEFWILARKPLSEKNVALNVLKWETGGINIDECRISYPNGKPESGWSKSGANGTNGYQGTDTFKIRKMSAEEIQKNVSKGRFPSNLILECTCDKTKQGQETISGGFGAMGIGISDTGKGITQDYEPEKSKKKEGTYLIHTDPTCPCYMLDEMSGLNKSSKVSFKNIGWKHSGNLSNEMTPLNYQNEFNDKGGASRFFYCAKSSRSERNFGLEDTDITEKPIPINEPHNSKNLEDRYKMTSKNNHPTVKSLKLMEYLVKLITKEGQIVLDPFLGSGTTAIACIKLNRLWIGIEKELEYIKIAEARIKPFLEQRKL